MSQITKTYLESILLLLMGGLITIALAARISMTSIPTDEVSIDPLLLEAAEKEGIHCPYACCQGDPAPLPLGAQCKVRGLAK